MSAAPPPAPRAEDHEEVRLEAGPVHFPEARDSGGQLDSLHVPDDLVAHPDAELVGDTVATEIRAPRRRTTVPPPGARRPPASRDRCCGTPAGAPGLPPIMVSVSRRRTGGPSPSDPHRHDRHRRGGGETGESSACRTVRGWSGWMSKRTRFGRAGPPVTLGSGAGWTGPAPGCRAEMRRSRWPGRR